MVYLAEYKKKHDQHIIGRYANMKKLLLRWFGGSFPLRMYAALKMRIKNYPQSKLDTWEGVYQSAEAARSAKTLPGYDSAQYAESRSFHIIKLLKGISGTQESQTTCVDESGHFVACLAPYLTPSKKVNILDWGGGLGIEYITLRMALPKMNLAAYNIVEVPAVVEVGQSIFKGSEHPVFFHTKTPDINHDIVIIKTALQYLDEPFTLLKELASTKPDRIVLFDFLGGYNAPYYSVQKNLYFSGCEFVTRIGSIQEMVTKMEEFGYDLEFKSFNSRPFKLGKLPEEFNITKTVNLSFVKSDNI